MIHSTSMRNAIFSTVVALFVPCASSFASDLITDRPDFTESAVVVPAGTVQVEGGVTWEEAGNGLEVLSGPEILVRWGLGDRFELRLGASDHIDPNRGRSGLGDGFVGAKVQFGPLVSGWDLALIGGLTVPLGDDGLTSDEFDPSLILTVGRDLRAGWSIGTQVGVARESAGPRDLDTTSATVVLGRGLGSRVGTFFEIAVTEPDIGDTSVLFHHGYTFALGPLLQLDLHAGAGLTDGAPDSLVGFGLSWRSGGS